MRAGLIRVALIIVILSLVPLSVAASSFPNAPAAPDTNASTVTATGTGVVPPPDDPLTVYIVQLQGVINDADPRLNYDAYVTRLDGIRAAVIAAGANASGVTPAKAYAQPTGPGTISFNGVFRYEIPIGRSEIAVSRAAFAAGASMVYNNMPAPAVTTRVPDGVALDRAIADAKAMARDRAARAVNGRVRDAIATTLVVKGDPEGTPLQWKVEVTMTFNVGP